MEKENETDTDKEKEEKEGEKPVATEQTYKQPEQRDALWFEVTAELAKLLLRQRKFDGVTAAIKALSNAFPTVHQQFSILALELSVCVENQDTTGMSAVLARANALIDDQPKVWACGLCVSHSRHGRSNCSMLVC